MSWEIILAIVTSLASIAGSAYSIKAIIKHEMEQCDLRMEAFREGLDHGEKEH